MNGIAFLFQAVLVKPILTILVAIYQALVFIHIPSPFGISIILLTILFRIVLYPVASSQLKASAKMQKVAPHLSKLKEKHKGDSKTLQAETMKLYKEHGVNPAAGCLPLLIQLPIFYALYAVLNESVSFSLSKLNSQIYFPFLKLTYPWSVQFLGVSLAKQPAQLLGSVGLIVLLVPLLTGVSQFIQTKMMTQSLEDKLQAVEKDAATTKDKELIREVKKEDDFATAFQSQSLYLFPAMIAFFSYRFAIGLSLYWITTTLFGILQQYHVAGIGGLSDWIGKNTFLSYEKKPSKK